MKKILIGILISINLFASELKTVKVGNLMYTRTEEQLKKGLQIANSGDNEAFKKYLLGLMLTDNGGVLKQDEKIYLEDVTWGGNIKFRKQGDTRSNWTILKAINGK